MPSLSLRLVAAASVLALGSGAIALPTASASSPGGAPTVQRVAPPVAPATSTGSTWAQARRAAQAALGRAQAQLTGSVAARPGRQERTDLTLTLRDLHAGLPFLGRAERAAAQRVLARPNQHELDPNGDGYTTKPRRRCGEHVCVWWVTSTSDRVPAVDRDANGYPDQVDLTRSVMDHVWDRIVTQGGYRAPLADGRPRGDDRFDVFLADIGDEGLFGYCAPEDPGPGRSASGYCVLDNDFSPKQFGSTQTPRGNLEVTAAHEFFHAVQFAYDALEDDWFMEGTAMWMEDEIYDDVNDNVRYLQGSQLTAPTRPLDRPATGMGGPYISWIFWRYVTEQLPDQGDTGLPLVVRDVWRRAQAYDSSLPSTYSLRALALALKARGTTLPTVFAHFGEANRHARQAYAEGSAQRYPVVPPVASYTLSTTHRAITEKVATMPHLTNYSVVFTPGASLTASGWRLRIPVNMPAYARGSRAQLSVVGTDGSRTRTAVSLDRHGNGVALAPFRRGEVARVELTLTNAGQRYRCNQGTAQACGGTSLDDGLRSYFTASVQR